MSKKAWFFLALLLLIHLGILTNIRFTAWPEMLSYPYLLSNGYKLYSDFVHPYPPLLTLLLAGLYKIFGFKVLTLKFVSWFFILASDVFLFLIVKKLLKKETPVFLLLVPYVLMQSFLGGNMLWFDNALVLPVTASLYYLINWSETKKTKELIFASLFLTAGVFIKQTAAIYFLASAVFILFSTSLHSNRLKMLKLFLIPSVISGIVFLLYLISANSFELFWKWSFYYPLTFWSKFPGYVDISLSFGEKAVLVLTLLPLLGAFAIRKKIVKDKLFLLVAGFLVASLIAVYPRFSFFHLQPVFAVAFVAFAFILKHLKKSWYLGVVAAIGLLAVYPTFNDSLIRSTRFFDGEDQKTIEMVSALSTKEEKVLLPGLSSAVYVFAERLPPKPWADNFGWYWEVSGWWENTLEGFEKDPPAKIFYKVPERGNWFDLGVYRPQKLVNYMYEHYYRDSEPIGGIELWKRKD